MIYLAFYELLLCNLILSTMELSTTDKKFPTDVVKEKGQQHRELRVVVVSKPPFVQLKSSNNLTLTGNDRFEGYSIDLLKKLADMLHFNYTIYEVPDNATGTKNDKGEWNGMIAEIIRKEADFAASPLTITKERNDVVSFTAPFMHIGVGILYKKSKKKNPSFFTFLSPLSLEVWMSMLAAFVTVVLAFLILGRISPTERYHQHPGEDLNLVKSKFSLQNSFWLAIGSLMQQGSDVTPKAPSTRCLAGFWWFFTLITVSSYTANLAAFLTVARMESPIESVDDLVKQSAIKYGIQENSASVSLFKESKIPTYRLMWAFMQAAQPSVFVKTSEGVQRVKNESYAYLTDKPTIDYYIARDCTLMHVGELLDSKGLAIALQKGSPYLEPISSAILDLQDRGTLDEIKFKWWKENSGKQCQEESQDTRGTNALGLSSVAGAYVILLCGLILSFIISGIECAKQSGRMKKDENNMDNL